MTPHRRIRGWRRAAPWLAAGLVLAFLSAGGGAQAIARAGAVPEVGYAHPTVANESYVVNITDSPLTPYVPRYLTADPGANVSIKLNNNGSIPHTFTLSSVSKATFQLNWTPQQLNATFNAHPPLVNVSVAPGATKYANFTLAANLSFDSFEFVSVVPYQFQAGWWGYLNVTSNSPPQVADVNTTDQFAFVPSAVGIEPASFPTNVAIFLTNEGNLEHTFTLVAQPNVSIGSIDYFDEPNNTPLVNQQVPSGAGSTAWANFTILKPGVYEFVCTEPGHFTDGMFGYIYAGEPVPPPTPAPSTAIVDTWILAGSLALIGIAGLLLLVATFTGRLPEPPKSPGHGH